MARTKVERGRSRAVIADDNENVRGGLRTLLETDRRIEVVGEAADGAGADEVVLEDESAGTILAAVRGGARRAAAYASSQRPG